QRVLCGAVRSLAALACVIELAVAALLLAVLGRVGVADRWRLAGGLAAVGVGLTHLALADGHPAEAVVPLLWVLAALWAREDRVVAAGTLIGVSAGLELWGALGAAAASMRCGSRRSRSPSSASCSTRSRSAGTGSSPRRSRSSAPRWCLRSCRLDFPQVVVCELDRRNATKLLRLPLVPDPDDHAR